VNGTVAQIISIVSYGNEYLLNNNNGKLTFNNTTFKYCNNVCFIDWVKPTWFQKNFKGMKKHYEVSIASDFEHWLYFLKKRGIKRLYLHYVESYDNECSARMTSGFVGGGGRWLIEAYNGDVSDFWEAKWEVTDKDNPERRIWKVTYARIARDSESRIELHGSINGIKEKILTSVEDCKEFAEKHGLTGFQNCFEGALLWLDGCSEARVYYEDIIPEAHDSSEARNILFSCQLAWVFGGMGSWNDLCFEGQEQGWYEQISDRLFNTICYAIPCATNSLIS